MIECLECPAILAVINELLNLRCLFFIQQMQQHQYISTQQNNATVFLAELSQINTNTFRINANSINMHSAK